MTRIRLLVGVALVAANALDAQQTSRTEPVTGLRDNGTGFHALVGARVVTGARSGAPQRHHRHPRTGSSPPSGATVRRPAGARVWDLAGQTIYPGFIDAHADLGVGEVPQGGDVGPTHWNPQVRAWFSTTANLKDDTHASRRRCARSASAPRSSCRSRASSAARRPS